MSIIKRPLPDSPAPIPDIYAKGQWARVSYTAVEGGEWIEYAGAIPKVIAAIQYANGWIYDFVLDEVGHPTPWRHIDGENIEVPDE